MKKLIRICAAMLAAGVALCIGGAVAGGVLYTSYVNGELRPFGWWNPRPHAEIQSGLDGIQPDLDGRTGAGRGNGGSVWEPAAPAKTGLPDIPDSLPGITELETLDFELGAGRYRLVEGECCGIDCNDGSGGWLTSDIENGVWKLRTDRKPFHFHFGDVRECTIIVPSGCTVDKVLWDLGAANMEIHAPITTDTLELEVDAAKAVFHEAVTAKKADFAVGAGNLELYALDVSEKIDAEVGAGNLELHALAVPEKISAEVGAGNMELYLPGSWDDYAVNAEVAMGTISLNGSALARGLAGSYTKGGGRCKIDLEAGMGNISIYTAAD